jgi:parallel beta-helix repeat protein
VCLNSNTFSIIEYNYIALNQADSGGGILVGWECNPIIRFNTIEENEAFYAGGGIYVSANGRSTIKDNIIRQNHSGGWGGGGINLWSATWLYGTYSLVYNNLIADNSASDGGGGIYSRYETSEMVNNTITGNQASRGGAVYVSPLIMSLLSSGIRSCGTIAQLKGPPFTWIRRRAVKRSLRTVM